MKRNIKAAEENVPAVSSPCPVRAVPAQCTD